MTKDPDQMPRFDSLEFQTIFERAEKLSTNDILDLLELVGIRFASRDSRNEFASRQELKDTPKDMLLGPLDEADSYSKVKQFLKEKGV